MMKNSKLIFTIVFVAVASTAAHAQGGCTDSPENPTLLLAGLTGGAFAVSTLRNRWAAKRRSVVRP